jgi:hypothetical protein
MHLRKFNTRKRLDQEEQTRVKSISGLLISLNSFKLKSNVAFDLQSSKKSAFEIAFVHFLG